MGRQWYTGCNFGYLAGAEPVVKPTHGESVFCLIGSAGYNGFHGRYEQKEQANEAE